MYKSDLENKTGSFIVGLIFTNLVYIETELPYLYFIILIIIHMDYIPHLGTLEDPVKHQN